MRGPLAAVAALLLLPAAASATDPTRSLSSNLRLIGLGHGAQQAQTDCVSSVCEVAWADRAAPYAVHARRVDTAQVKLGHTMTFGPELDLPLPASGGGGHVPRVLQLAGFTWSAVVVTPTATGGEMRAVTLSKSAAGTTGPPTALPVDGASMYDLGGGQFLTAGPSTDGSHTVVVQRWATAADGTITATGQVVLGTLTTGTASLGHVGGPTSDAFAVGYAGADALHISLVTIDPVSGQLTAVPTGDATEGWTSPAGGAVYASHAITTSTAGIGASLFGSAGYAIANDYLAVTLSGAKLVFARDRVQQSHYGVRLAGNYGSAGTTAIGLREKGHSLAVQRYPLHGSKAETTTIRSDLATNSVPDADRVPTVVSHSIADYFFVYVNTAGAVHGGLLSYSAVPID